MRPIVVLQAQEIAKQTNEWNNALVELYYMKNYIATYWNFVAVPELYHHEAFCYTVKFQDQNDMKSCSLVLALLTVYLSSLNSRHMILILIRSCYYYTIMGEAP